MSKLQLLYKLGSACWQQLWLPKDPSNLAVTRILFGILMALDVLHERGFAEVDHRFGDPKKCHFPLFDFLEPLPFQWMCLLYLLMWFGALGITVGYHFRLSCLCFAVPYWYIFFLDKTAWNNHTYLYGLLSILLLVSSANHYWSVDGWLHPEMQNKAVPHWNYMMLRFQIFLLYFYAGVKKLDPEWLGGYSMKGYGNHCVFAPFRTLLDEDTIEYVIVHLGGFLLDLTIGFWLLWPKSRSTAIFFGASFHLMNSQLFSIGMFPYVCLATLPVFCQEDWPKTCWISKAPQFLQKCLLPTTESFRRNDQVHQPSSSVGDEVKNGPPGKRKGVKAALMAFYIVIQLTLPWTHSITQGYNNWTNGLYGYSWDMMVHAWETMHVVITVRHKESGRIDYLDTEAFVRNDKWVGHADMVYQYAHCVRERLEAANVTGVAIHADVWRSLNGRFQQRLVDPRVDLLEADWSPWRPTPWIMPLLSELSPWRGELARIERELRLSAGPNASVLFVADFPGLSMENYVPAGVSNASLRVLDGQVQVWSAVDDEEEGHNDQGGTGTVLNVNETVPLSAGAFYTVLTTSTRPACYMYTFHGEIFNATSASPSEGGSVTGRQDNVTWLSPLTKSAALVGQSLLSLLLGIPLVPAVVT